MRLAVFGGSFNPVHRGHEALAESVARLLGYDRILITPALMSPHKGKSGYIATEHRINMLEAAFGDKPWAEICLLEINRSGLSYTVDTLHEIYDAYRFDGKPGLIVGDDWADGFERWRSVERIRELTDLIVARREGGGGNFPFPCTYLENPIVRASSTEIREMISRGESVEEFVSPAVYRYLKDNGLYETR
jgi:nicotinate-nucleotide adenylyltransferase